MAAASPVSIGFIGFGEVGQTFSRGLLRQAGVVVRAWDILFGQPLGARLTATASALGVTVVDSAQAAAAGADVVISAVTADRSLEVAEQAAGYLRPGQIFFDVNSAAPSTKRRAAQAVEAAGARYVEGAVMAPVLKPGLRAPILAGGPGAAAAAGLLNGLGMNLTPVSETHGRASAMKLCRSIVIKGLEALMVDCARASARWDVQAEVFGSLAGTFPSIDWNQLAQDMTERVATHGVRRAAEMREAAEMLAQLDLDPDLALAVASAQQRNAKPKS